MKITMLIIMAGALCTGCMSTADHSTITDFGFRTMKYSAPQPGSRGFMRQPGFFEAIGNAGADRTPYVPYSERGRHGVSCWDNGDGTWGCQ